RVSRKTHNAGRRTRQPCSRCSVDAGQARGGTTNRPEPGGNGTWLNWPARPTSPTPSPSNPACLPDKRTLLDNDGARSPPANDLRSPEMPVLYEGGSAIAGFRRRWRVKGRGDTQCPDLAQS